MKPKIYLNILNKQQLQILPHIKQFYPAYYLVGGTAIALQLGHRASIDFDLFTFENKNNQISSAKLLKQFPGKVKVLSESKDQSHYIVNGVKVSFVNFPHKIPAKAMIDKIKIPELLTLAAMKAFAIGRRAKWKDYVDIFFILKSGITLEQIIEKAVLLFNTKKNILFNQRVFLEQLNYFEDINYDEEVIYFGELKPSEKAVKKYLVNETVSFLKLKTK